VLGGLLLAMVCAAIAVWGLVEWLPEKDKSEE